MTFVVVLVGFVLAAVIAAWFRSKARRSGSPWRAKARTQSEVRLDMGAEAARHHVAAVLSAIGTLRATTEPNAEEAVTGSSWRSSGTVVRVELRPRGDVIDAAVTAWPGAQLFDWGEARRVAREVCHRLSQQPEAAL